MKVVVHCVEQTFRIHDKSALGVVVDSHVNLSKTRSSLREDVKVQRFDTCPLRVSLRLRQ